MKKIIIIALLAVSFTACDNRRQLPVNDWSDESYDDGAYMDNGGGYYNSTNHNYYNRGGQLMNPRQRTHYISNRNQYNTRHAVLRKQHLIEQSRQRRNEQARRIKNQRHNNATRGINQISGRYSSRFNQRQRSSEIRRGQRSSIRTSSSSRAWRSSSSSRRSSGFSSFRSSSRSSSSRRR